MPADHSPRPSATMPLWAAAVAIVLTGFAGIGVGFLAGRASVPAATPVIAEGEPSARTMMTREEFRRTVEGKTPDEVSELLGRPDSTSESGTTVYWHYANRSRDTATGKLDSDAQVIFKSGRVVRINF